MSKYWKQISNVFIRVFLWELNDLGNYVSYAPKMFCNYFDIISVLKKNEYQKRLTNILIHFPYLLFLKFNYSYLENWVLMGPEWLNAEVTIVHIWLIHVGVHEPKMRPLTS